MDIKLWSEKVGGQKKICTSNFYCKLTTNDTFDLELIWSAWPHCYARCDLYFLCGTQLPVLGVFTKISNQFVLNKMIITWKVLEFPLKWGVNHLIWFRNSRVSDEKWMLKNHQICLKIVTLALPLTCAQNYILVPKFSQWRQILQKSAIN